MAVALLNGVTNVITAAASPTSPNAHTFASSVGTNTCAFAMLATDGGTTPNITGATFGGSTMILAGTVGSNTSGALLALIFYLVSPTTGASVSLSVSFTGGPVDIYATVFVFQNVNQATPIRPGSYVSTSNVLSNSSGVFSQAITSNANDLTISAFSGGPQGINSTNQTGTISNAGTGGGGADYNTVAGASITHTWTKGSVAATEIAFAGLSINGDPSAAIGTGFDYRPNVLHPGQNPRQTLRVISPQAYIIGPQPSLDTGFISSLIVPGRFYKGPRLQNTQAFVTGPIASPDIGIRSILPPVGSFSRQFLLRQSQAYQTAIIISTSIIQRRTLGIMNKVGSRRAK